MATVLLLPHELFFNPAPQNQKQYLLSFSATYGTSYSGTKPAVTLHLQEQQHHAPRRLGSPAGTPWDKSKTFDFSGLVTFPDAKRAVAEMLANSTFNTRDFKLLCKYLSFYVHRAAIAARKSQAGSLSLTLVIHVIEGSVRSLGLVAGEAEVEFPESCPICMEDLTFSDGEEIISIPCDHIFHRICLRQWTERGIDCLLCRFAA